jgi:hypothetical protein
MTVYVVYESKVAEHEESFGVMSVHSSEEKAKEAVTEYEAVAAGCVRGRAEYSIEEYELDSSYYGWKEASNG